eukprot:11345964-Alexandrium_andersonii.AAC.1
MTNPAAGAGSGSPSLPVAHAGSSSVHCLEAAREGSCVAEEALESALSAAMGISMEGGSDLCESTAASLALGPPAEYGPEVLVSPWPVAAPEDA